MSGVLVEFKVCKSERTSGVWFQDQGRKSQLILVRQTLCLDFHAQILISYQQRWCSSLKPAHMFSFVIPCPFSVNCKKIKRNCRSELKRGRMRQYMFFLMLLVHLLILFFSSGFAMWTVWSTVQHYSLKNVKYLIPCDDYLTFNTWSKWLNSSHIKILQHTFQYDAFHYSRALIKSATEVRWLYNGRDVGSAVLLSRV